MPRPISTKNSPAPPRFRGDGPRPLGTPMELAAYIAKQLKMGPGNLTAEDVLAFCADRRPAPPNVLNALLEQLRSQEETARRHRVWGFYPGEVFADARAPMKGPGRHVHLPSDVVLQWMSDISTCIRELPDTADHFKFGDPPERREFELSVRRVLGVGLGIPSTNPYDPPRKGSRTHAELLKGVSGLVDERASAMESQTEPHTMAQAARELSVWLDVIVEELDQANVTSSWGSTSAQQARAFVHVQIMQRILPALASIVPVASPSDDPLIRGLRTATSGSAGDFLLALPEALSTLLEHPMAESGEPLIRSLAELHVKEERLLAILRGAPFLTN